MKSGRWRNLCFIFAGLLFNNWLLGLLLNFQLLSRGGSISEFSAVTQPHNLVFRILDVAAGVLIVIGSASLLKFKDGNLWQALAIAGIILGVSNCLDALLPLPCSGTLNAGCNAPVKLNFHRLSLPDHAISSTLIGLCLVVLPLGGIILSRRKSNFRFKALSIAALVLMVVFLVFLTLESLFENSQLEKIAGFSQDLQMLSFGLWLVAWPRLISHDKRTERTNQSSQPEG